MKRIYSSADGLMVNHLRNLLESYGIQCIVKNDVLAGAAGELPPTECWPELWIKNDAQLIRAGQIVRDVLRADRPDRPTWRCPKCAEEIEDQFGQCWQCGTPRDCSDFE